LLDKISKEKSTAKKKSKKLPIIQKIETGLIKNINKPERQFEYNNLVSHRRKKLDMIREQVGSDYKIQTSRISNLKQKIQKMIKHVSSELQIDREAIDLISSGKKKIGEIREDRRMSQASEFSFQNRRSTQKFAQFSNEKLTGKFGKKYGDFLSPEDAINCGNKNVRIVEEFVADGGVEKMQPQLGNNEQKKSYREFEYLTPSSFASKNPLFSTYMDYSLSKSQERYKKGVERRGGDEFVLRKKEDGGSTAKGTSMENRNLEIQSNVFNILIDRKVERIGSTDDDRKASLSTAGWSSKELDSKSSQNTKLRIRRDQLKEQKSFNKHSVWSNQSGFQPKGGNPPLMDMREFQRLLSSHQGSLQSINLKGDGGAVQPIILMPYPYLMQEARQKELGMQFASDERLSDYYSSNPKIPPNSFTDRNGLKVGINPYNVEPKKLGNFCVKNFEGKKFEGKNFVENAYNTESSGDDYYAGMYTHNAAPTDNFMNEDILIAKTEDLTNTKKLTEKNFLRQNRKKAERLDIFGSMDQNYLDDDEPILSVRDAYINSSRSRKRKVEEIEAKRENLFIDIFEGQGDLRKREKRFRDFKGKM
jgi:ribosomal protein S18